MLFSSSVLPGHWPIVIGVVANGLLAKFASNFTGLAVSFFGAVM